MTSRERIDRVMRHEQADRTPIFEYVFSKTVPEALLGRRYYNYDYDTDEWDARVAEVGIEAALKQYVADRLDLCELLGHDMLYVIPNPGWGEGRAFPDRQVYDADDPVECLIARNERWRWEQDANPTDPTRFLVYDLLVEEMARRGLAPDLFAPCYCHGASTDAVLLQSMLLDEEATREHYALCTRDALRYVAEYAKRGVRHIGVGGDFSGNRPIISPECYRKYIVPEVRKNAEAAHAVGAWAVNASDGDLWPVIDDFLIGCGADAYMEIDARAGMDLRRLKALYGDRVTLYGNIDCGAALSYDSPDALRALTLRCLEDGAGNGGHIFTASNAITSTIPVVNYLAMVNAYRAYFGLPEVTAKA